MKVNEVQVTPIKPFDGLVAFASCVLDEQLYIGSLGVHQRLDGTGYRLTYPAKKVGVRQLNYYHPLTKELGLEIEKAINAKCIELFERSDGQNGRHSQTTDSHL